MSSTHFVSVRRRPPLERARHASDRLAALQLQTILLADMRAEAIGQAVAEGRTKAAVARELGISFTQVSKAVERAARLIEERRR